VHDIADLESRGIPGVFIASSVFVEAAAAQSAALGVTPRSVFVAHPIQDRTDDEMRELAEQAIDALVSALTKAR
jgi:alkanesulfonate monooxygenase SsuD/methylene tetrahydromethanopterin reductase-like flavin-dependent oxidoreductase (luciferase family)